MKQAFHNFLQKYSDIQKEAVMHGNGPLLVSAGPGSGKTTVLTGRIVYLLQEKNVQADSIAVITYTKEAAASMEKRFQNVYSAFGRKTTEVSFSTFHSLFYRILRSFQAYQNFQIIQEESQRKLIHYILEDKVFPEYPLWSTPSVFVMVDQVKSAVSFYKNTMDFERYQKLLPCEFVQKAVEILEIYQKELISRGYLDMDDLLYVTYKVLKEHKAFLREWQGRFRHYLVDEFQDCNSLQYELLKLLAAEAESLFVVGDEDQAIYGFRGAKPGIMAAFQSDFPFCKMIALGENYRSIPKIVESADLVIRESKNRQEKKLISMVNPKDNKQEATECVVFLNRSQEWGWIYEKLSQMNADQQNETCVLFRTNLLLQAFTTGLRKNHIPFYTKERGKCIYEHSVYLDVMAYLQVAHQKCDRGLFLRVLRAPFIGVGREALTQEQVSLEQVKKFYQRGAYKNEKTVENIEKLQRNLDRISRFSPALAVNYIRKALRYEEYLTERWKAVPEQLKECILVLDHLQEEAKIYNDIEEWVKNQRDYIKFFNQMKRERGEKRAGVQVMTLHASKGLEFRQVFIPDVNDGVIPKTEKNKGNHLSMENLEEERRLFYVGITRAKERLVLSYVTGTQQKPSQPSRFISVLFDKNRMKKIDYSSSSLANSSNS